MAAPNLPDPTPQSQPTGEPTSPQPATTWRDGLPNEYRDHPLLKQHPDPASLAKWAINAESLIGRKGVILPKENDPADLDRFYNQLGRPESPDKYDLSGFAPPEGLSWDESFQSEMLADMHALGLSNAQAKGVFEKYAARLAPRAQQFEQAAALANEQATKALRQEWGTAFDAKVNIAARFIQTVAGDKAEAILTTRLADGSFLGDHPEFVRMMAKASESVSEDVLSVDSTLRTMANQTPQQAADEIARLRGDKEFMDAFFDRDHPGHGEANQRMQRLNEILYAARK